MLPGGCWPLPAYTFVTEQIPLFMSKLLLDRTSGCSYRNDLLNKQSETSLLAWSIREQHNTISYNSNYVFRPLCTHLLQTGYLRSALWIAQVNLLKTIDLIGDQCTENGTISFCKVWHTVAFKAELSRIASIALRRILTGIDFTLWRPVVFYSMVEGVFVRCSWFWMLCLIPCLKQMRGRIRRPCVKSNQDCTGKEDSAPKTVLEAGAQSNFYVLSLPLPAQCSLWSESCSSQMYKEGGQPCFMSASQNNILEEYKF